MQKTSKSRKAPEGATSRGTALSLEAVLPNPIFHLFLILLVGVAAYSNTFQVPFVIDDEASILENPAVKNLSSFIFEGSGLAYNTRRVVGYLSFALNYRLGGEEVLGYHLVNLAVHLFNGSLVYALLSLSLKTPLLADTDEAAEGGAWRLLLPLFAALFFIAHPVQTQAVTYVVQRLASLATLFYLLSVLCYLKGRLLLEAGRAPARVFPAFLGCAISALLAFFTKETAYTLPLALVLYEFTFFGVTRRKVAAVSAAAALCLLVLTVVFAAGSGEAGFVARLDALTRETDSITRTDYLLTKFTVLATYLRLVIFPVGQNLDYDYPVYHSLLAPRVGVSLVALVLLFACAIALYRRRKGEWGGLARIAGFGILWFFLTSAIESGPIPIRDVIFEHRLYLPSFGLFGALAALFCLLLRRMPVRGGVMAGGSVVILLALLAWKRNEVWGDPVTLWRDCSEKAPGKLRPRNNLANALLAKGRPQEAVEQLKVALAIAPGDPAALRNLGAAYEAMGDLDRGIEQYRLAAAADPADKFARYNLGIAYSKKGLPFPAVDQFKAALAIDPGYAQAHNNLGVVYAGGGEMQAAIVEFREAVRLDPGSAQARMNLGRALGGVGKGNEALEELERALRLAPQNAEIYNCMGVIYAELGKKQAAAAYFKKASELAPGEQRYADNLYRLQLSGG